MFGVLLAVFLDCRMFARPLTFEDLFGDAFDQRFVGAGKVIDVHAFLLSNRRPLSDQAVPLYTF